MTHMQIPALLAVGALTACVENTPTVAAPRCDPAAHQALVGQNIGAVTLPDDLPHRVLSPGDVATMDLNPNRLNIFVDPKGWIGRVTCG